MDDDSRALDKGWDALPEYREGAGDAEEAVTVSISTAPGEWLVNTNDAVVVPMSMAEVVDALRLGKLTERSLVWRNGMAEWLQVERVPQLKLAARLPATVARPAPRLSPPPKPAKSLRSSTAPQGTPRDSISPEAPSSPRASRPPPPSAARPSVPSAARPPLPVASRASNPPLSRASNPLSRPSNPLMSRPSNPPLSRPSPVPSSPRSSLPAPPRSATPRTALPPPPAVDDAVLAIYERPPATISFELSPEESTHLRLPAPAAVPQTLAPLTSDNAPSKPAPRGADLSVVAASQFREQRRSSQRTLWISSIGSAAAASLLTLWLSSGGTPTRDAATAPPVASELAPPALPPVAATAANAPELVAAPHAAPSSDAPSPKAKSKRKARAWHPPRVAPVAAPNAPAPDPSNEPNPYDVKLAEDPPPAVKQSPSDGAVTDSVGSGESKSPSGDTP